MKIQIRTHLSVLLCVVMLSLCGCHAGEANETDSSASAAVTFTEKKAGQEELLASWAEGEDSVKQQILNYIKKVTNAKNENFIPVEDRIAVFDMDGTILCEQPSSMELLVAEHRIQTDLIEDKELNNNLKQLLEKFKEEPMPEDTWTLYGKVVDQAFEGMTEDEMSKYIADFVITTHPEDFGSLYYVDLFYKPMIELFQYLEKNQFEIYLVSGSMRAVVCGCIEGYNRAYPKNPLHLKRSQMIGSDVEMIPSHNEEKASNYVYQPADKLLHGIERLTTNIGMEKVLNIDKQIGKVPVFAGGNSDGDFSMLNMAKSSVYPNMALLIWHDSKKEYEYSTSDAWKKEAKHYKWKRVSIEEEWNQVFMK